MGVFIYLLVYLNWWQTAAILVTVIAAGLILLFFTFMLFLKSLKCEPKVYDIVGSSNGGDGPPGIMADDDTF
jgi:hypothetical protein